MAVIGQWLSFILGKIVQAVAWIGELVVAAFVALWDLAADAFAWAFEQLLDVAIAALGAIDLSAITSEATVFGSLPAQVIEGASAVGIGTGLTIIGAALVVRFALQLIPFVRLGS